MTVTTISSEGAGKLLEQLAPEQQADWRPLLDDADEWQLWTGELVSDGHFELSGRIIVHGDVKLGGDFSPDYDDTVIVVGNVDCEIADIGGETLIVGNLTASSFVHACSSNDHSLGVTGAIVSKLFAESGTATFAGRFDCLVWRTMNVVVRLEDGHKFAKTATAQLSEHSARAAGLEAAEIEELSGRLGVPLK